MSREDRDRLPTSIRFEFGNGYVRDAISTVANRERSLGWWYRPARRRRQPRGCLGWYGEHCQRHQGADRPLECWADLRGWLKCELIGISE